jgi:glycosyltransferase involved in cell wall biosynthesis
MVKKKILYLVTEDWYFWSHRLPIARAAKEQGYQVVIATRVQAHGERIKNEGFKLIPLSMRRRSKNPVREIAALFQLYRIYRQEKPDLVHHVALKPILYGSLAAQFSGISNVVNALTGLGYVFTAQGAWASLLRKVVALLYRFAFSADNCRVIFQNPEDASLLTGKGIVSVEKTVLIRGSGVDVQLFTPAEEEPPGPPKIIIVSRMLKDKGIAELVAAAAMLNQQRIACQFLLAGIPDPENPASISEEQLLAWNREYPVSWLGYVDDVPILLKQCHIGVLASYREGVPKGLLEVAAAGLPVVATDVPGCREVVRHGVNGFLVPPKDPISLAEALTRLVQDKGMRQRMGKAGREIAVNEFSEEQVIRDTLNLYEKMLTSS